MRQPQRWFTAACAMAFATLTGSLAIPGPGSAPAVVAAGHGSTITVVAEDVSQPTASSPSSVTSAPEASEPGLEVLALSENDPCGGVVRGALRQSAVGEGGCSGAVRSVSAKEGDDAGGVGDSAPAHDVAGASLASGVMPDAAGVDYPPNVLR